MSPPLFGSAVAGLPASVTLIVSVSLSALLDEQPANKIPENKIALMLKIYFSYRYLNGIYIHIFFYLKNKYSIAVY